MSFLRINNVTKRIKELSVLHRFSLEVQEGELITMLGSSGCGKSTLLRCIAGLLAIDEGEIVLDGKSLDGVAPKARDVGMVFQSYALFPNMTAGENIAFGLQTRRMSKKQIADRVYEMLQLIGMEERRDAYPHQLSGGQQQRVSLARSLAVEPKLLLLDEPLSALDAKIRKNLRLELRRIQRRLGMTTIFVTHDQEEALTISDRVCIMDRGQVVQIGKPEDVYTQPHNEFVASFIGSYNVLSGDQLNAFQTPQPKSPGTRFAVRPEAIELLPYNLEVSGEERALVAEGVIEEVAVLGSIVRYTVDVQGTSLVVDTLNAASCELKEVGSKAWLRIPLHECKGLELSASPS